ncbi:hypothetical protein ACFSPU_01570 [Haoranjiania flava]|uniref:Uncharacterized protein n=1 Tax=Haoranjiania flava TaxID=1856322 RepID=A0AAE3LIT5_9BACT|nr:hypothetical protein [Haoranjiania flava]MCU7692923.1 hypothetical protein [Haoranjiania flava]
MKQIILLISIISSLFTYNTDDEASTFAEKLKGGWTLTPGSKISYYDAFNNLVDERIVPLSVSGTILHIQPQNLIIRDNKNNVKNLVYQLDENSYNSGKMTVQEIASADNKEIISLLSAQNLSLSSDKSNALRIQCAYEKNYSSDILDKSVDFDHAVVEMVFNKNSLFSDLILPY